MANDKTLKLLLRLMGAMELGALVGVCMPTALMAAAHEWLGLGRFPDGEVTPYLARCLSALYAMHGGFVWVASHDVRRYSGLIRYVAYTGIAFSVLICVLDILAGFPWWWLIAEGPTLTAACLVFLYLDARVRRDARDAGSASVGRT